METTCIFKRIEEKYLLSEEQYESLSGTSLCFFGSARI